MAILINIAAVALIGTIGIAMAFLTLAGSILDFVDMVNMLIDIVQDVI